MSNALALATVTETLRRKLDTAVAASQVDNAHATALRPDDSTLAGTAVTPGVNVFLYQVTPNVSWRNADLPTRRSDGSLLRRPQVALDLHYLLSFYGSDLVLEPQRILGAAIRALHANPVLARADVQATEIITDTNTNKLIYASNLSQQVDLVRFTPIHFSLEELSKLWSVFLKTDYVLSLAYMASVVLIETDDPPPAPALPALTPRVLAVPLSLAVIDTVTPQALALSTMQPNQLVLQGRALDVNSSVVFTTPGGTAPVAGTIGAGSTSGQMVVTLPAGLRPGANTLQLTSPAPATQPPEGSPHVSAQSNVAAFVILPNLVSVAPVAGGLTAVVSPGVGVGQQVSLVLNQLGGAALAFVLPAAPHDTVTDTFHFPPDFPSGSVPPGTYLVRVQVDAAESRLTVDHSGNFNGPVVILP